MIAMVIHRDQLRPHGAGVSQRRLGLHVCDAGVLAAPGLRDGLGNAHGLCAQSPHLDRMVQPGGNELRATGPVCSVGSRIFRAVHVREPGRHQELRAHLGRAGRDYRRRRSRVHRLRGMVRLASQSRLPGVLHPPVLRPQDLPRRRGSRRHLDRRAHLYRLRRHLDALGGGRGPSPQHPVRDRRDLRSGRHSVGDRGICRTAGMAHGSALQGYRHRVRGGRSESRRTVALRGDESCASGRRHRLRRGLASGRGETPLRHGPQQRPAAGVLRRGRLEDAAFRATT